jgi:hypothetical protein
MNVVKPRRWETDENDFYWKFLTGLIYRTKYQIHITQYQIRLTLQHI